MKKLLLLLLVTCVFAAGALAEAAPGLEAFAGGLTWESSEADINVD